MNELPSRRGVVGAGAAALGLVAFGCRAREAQGAAGDPELAPEREPDRGLAELLAENRRYHPIYGGGLANHLSMELCSLHAIGATNERLRNFAASYAAELEPFPDHGPPVSSSTWRAQLGHPEALHGFVEHFRGEIRARGREAALRAALAELAPSMGSELFHPLIRTSFGLRFGDDEEIAHGLAYWAIKPLSLGPLARATGGSADFAELCARIRATPALANAKLSGNSNALRMQAAARLDGFADVAAALDVRDDTLDRIARAVLALYASTRGFVALHAVTSTHALRVLLPYFPDRELALRHHAQALLAAYVRIGAPAFETSFTDEAPGWDAIRARAIASDDDHDAKFVFACIEEESARPDAPYRLAAARRVAG